MVDLSLFFLGTSILFFIVSVSVYVPTNSAEEFPFLMFWPTHYFLSSNGSHSNRCEMISPCDSDLPFPDDSDIEHLLM